MQTDKLISPHIDSSLRHNILRLPREVYTASGIVINGRRIKSFVFTTDLAIIRNCDADAVFAVYPFTPQQCISDAIIKASYIPVFCGVGGGTTKGLRTVGLAKDVESQGAMGVVLNAPISDLNLLAVARAVDIPVIITVTREDTDVAARIAAGGLHYQRGLRPADAGAGEKVPHSISGTAHHCFRRRHGGKHPAHHSGRGERHYLYAAFHGRAVPRDHGEEPGVTV